jgi:hypothetical protein
MIYPSMVLIVFLIFRATRPAYLSVVVPARKLKS